MTVASGGTDGAVGKRRPSIVLVFVDGDPRRYQPTVLDLVEASSRAVVVSAAEPDALAVFEGLPVEALLAPSAVAAVGVLAPRGTDLFIVTAPVTIPDDAVERSEAIVAGDLRVATVSFFSNDAGSHSFPDREPRPTTPAGFDTASLTARLREVPPELAPCPVDYAAGGAVMLSAMALVVAGAMVPGPAGTGFDASLADFSMRCRERGLIDMLDPGTYVYRPPAPGEPADRPVVPERDRAWLFLRHPQLVDSFERTSRSVETPLAQVARVSRVKALGLRVLIDDTTLGPLETGAQITTLAIIAALANHADVAEVGVALGHHIPAYARQVLGRPKVKPSLRSGTDYSAFAQFDILHRTTQPDRGFSVEAARTPARRVVVSVLDLIAYRAGSYHATADDWLEYRDALCSAVRAADGVTTISQDVAGMLALERLPIERDRLFPILYGTEHLTGREPAECPGELLARDRIADEFLLCLGTNYAHKNRDLAIAVHHDLRARGHEIALVLAGPSVPYGCSRNAERLLSRAEDDVLFLPNVSSAERNWLLRHATAVLYPTSAEGFGLVPFEAARFGTPTVSVRFGPFLETSSELPVAASSWDTREFANAVDELLRDPGLRRAQVDATLAAADRYSWQQTAEAFLDMYRTLLARPSR